MKLPSFLSVGIVIGSYFIGFGCALDTCINRLSTMYAIVTGGNAGMGLATAAELCKRGYHVTITARSLEKGNEAIDNIKADTPDAQIGVMVMELKELSSVGEFARQYIDSGLPLHLLVNNAGIMNTPFEMTTDGFEAQFQVNHLGHFLLTHHLLPLLQRSGGGRIVNLSSRAHMRWGGRLDLTSVRSETKENYDGWRSYGLSKLCNILFTRSLARRFPPEESAVLTFSLHPGLVDTKLLDTAPGLSSQAISINDGIKTAIHLSTAPVDTLENGEYYYLCAVARDPSAVSSAAKSMEDAEILWKASLEYVGLTDAEYGRS